ncbi:MAG: hypothetical protein JO306_16665, partial [Gemmatimonadetes bacterium]|nr:hypothetical protein [Gemmatimonadota bacterium]
HQGARWFWGTAFQFEPSERTQWVAEFHAETGGNDPARFVNFGLRRDLDAHRLLLFSLGRRVFLEGAPHETIAFLGLQIHG